MQQQTKLQRILLLPSKLIPQIFKPYIQDINDFSTRFINGYKNILMVLPTQQFSNTQELQWSLLSSQQHCGQAFCYLMKDIIIQQKLLQCSNTKNKINKINDQMYVYQSILKTQQQYQKQQLSAIKNIQLNPLRTLISLVSQAQNNQKLAINLVKNIFSQFSTYTKCCKQMIQKIQQQYLESNPQRIPTVAQTISNQYHGKKLMGSMIKCVPKCNKQTGNWNQQDTIQVNINL